MNALEVQFNYHMSPHKIKHPLDLPISHKLSPVPSPHCNSSTALYHAQIRVIYIAEVYWMYTKSLLSHIFVS